jgi:RNA polymerase sigma factor (sigma-70 family)
MSSQRLAIPDLGRIFRGETVSGLSDWQLLERYLERRDETAFEALVTRHGPMVLGVCRRMLGGSTDAEDGFQATFLILVRRARDLGPRDAIGPWLYGVATRVAARARTQAARRRRYHATLLELPIPDRTDAMVDPDLVDILDLELSRLPAKYRSPLVLCYLEGRTHEEAARDLQWPVGTVKGRLARARDLLRSRLARRGFAPSAGVSGVLLSPELSTILDRALIERTVGASVKLIAGQSTAQVISHSVTSLVEGVLGTMFVNKIKWAALAAVATGFAVTSAAVLGRQDAQPKPEAKKVNGKNVEPSAESTPPRLDETQKAVVATEEVPPEPAQRKSRIGVTKKMRVAGEVLEQEDDRANDPRSHRILARLEDPISMSFANETPLDDFLKYIKQATTTPTSSGIPIYVDPVGLQEAERSLNSTIQIDLEGVPLRRTLQLALTQLHMAYFVEDGILVITSEDSAKLRLPPSIAGPTPLQRRIEKAERGDLSSGELKELIEVVKLSRELTLLHESPPQQAQGGRLGGEFGGGGGQAKSIPDETKELLKEIRELIQLLKADREGKKAPERNGGLQ